MVKIKEVKKSEMLPAKAKDFLIDLELEGKSKQTIKTYASALRTFFEFNKWDMSNITLERVKEYLYHIKHKKNYSARSMHLHVVVLRRFLSYLGKDFLKELKPPRVGKNLPEVLSREEILKLVEAAEKTRDKAIILLLYSSGIRVSELCNLNLEDLNFEKNTIRISGGKGGKDRYTFFSEECKVELKKYLSSRKEKSGPLFLNNYGNRITPLNVQRMIKRLGKKAKIMNYQERCTPHKLRHSFATHLLDKEVDIRYIQELLGHSSLATTQIYTHVSLEELRKQYVKANLNLLRSKT